MTEDEVWQDVVGFERLYQVSNKGNVYSVGRVSSQGIKIGGQTLKPSYARGGYFKVGLYKNGTMETKQVHRLVAEAFIPNQNNYLEINHKDENKTNNHVENLEWCTREYNANFGTAIKRSSQARSKRVKAVNVETGDVITFNSVTEAMNKGYSSAISQACKGVYKSSKGNLIGDGYTYRGHKWSYEEEK